MKKPTLENAQKIAEKRGGICLSDKYIDCHTKMKWKCANGHIWLALYLNVKHGRWCPKCAKNLEKNSIEDAKLLAQNNKGECLSNVYINNRSKLKWRCKSKHEWETSYHAVRSGRWCPRCARNVRHTINDAKNLAKINNGFCLSNKYINANSKLKWMCNNGHVWKARFNDIYHGHWCPSCSKGVAEKELYNIISNLFLDCYVLDGYNEFPFLYNKQTKGNQHIDILIIKNNQILCAVEYDGRQHFEPVCFGGIDKDRALQNFNEQKMRDNRKNRIMEENKNIIPHFVRIKYTEKLTKINIKNILVKNGVYV